MGKIYKLFINENIKTWKKFSTKLGIVLVLLALIGVLALAQFTRYMNEKNNAEFADNNDWKTIARDGIEATKEELTKDNLDDQTIQLLKNRIKLYELSLKYDVPISAVEWKGKILLALQTSYEIDEKLINFIENDDYAGYIQYQKNEIKKELDKGQITQEEYNDEMVILNLYEKYEISKEKVANYSYEWRELLISDIKNWQQTVRSGIDNQTNKVLTPEKKEQYENNIKIAIYRIENDLQPSDIAYEQNYRILFESLAPNFVAAVIAILAIIIAGGAIATEISTGTIKFWALTPNKRWKILTAKILSFLFYILVITLVMAILTIVLGNIFFDTPGNEYLYVKNGIVKKIANVPFIISYYFVKIIPVIVFAIFALMLSVVTRNSSVALSLSIATYMGNGIVMSILNSYIKKDWVRFIPFNNLNIADKVFPNFSGMISGVETFATSTSLVFSLTVLGVCLVLMLVTAYDSFNNRDIL